MTTVLLIRHGRTSANASGVLAGWTPGVTLDDTGREQANALAGRLQGLPLAAAISSPLERCRETAGLALGDHHPAVELDERLGECHYGDWTGQPLKTLAKDPLWKVVQSHPSAVRFPGDGGESLIETQQRAVGAIREYNQRVGDGIYAVFSHGDVIKAILADALGQHLDQFQRIVVDPCSVSVVHYTELRPFVERMNDRSGELTSLAPKKKRSRKRAASSDAAVGGGSGERD